MPDSGPGSATLISAIVAMGRDRVIGDGEQMPWHLPGDLKRLKSITMGKPLIMGRRTFLSIGRPLPGRANIVMTRDRDWSADGVITAANLDDALEKAREWASENDADELIIFGGGEIYRQAMPLVQKIYLTLVEVEPEGEVRFPEINDEDWDQIDREDIPASENTPAFGYRTLIRRTGQS